MPAHDEPVGLTVHSMPSPGTLLEQQRTRRGRRVMLAVVVACLLPVLASYFTFYVIRPSNGGAAYSQLISPSVGLPDVSARTLDGAPVALRSLKGQWMTVVVDGGDCPAACEKRLFMQRQLREMTGKERGRIDKLWLVIDDAPVKPALRQVLQATPGMHILRLPRAEVAAWLRPEAGQALEDHLYLVDPMGEWMMRTPVNAEPGRVKRDLDRLLRASASWDLPGR